MGEQPIFTTKAHVFHIDPSTKKKWLPASSQSVGVSYYYDSARQTYRIISVDGTKAIINSTLSPNMVFTKTSQKFGQWSDQKANTVYGLGFGTEIDCTKFVEKFKEIKEILKKSQGDNSAVSTNGETVQENLVSSSEVKDNPSVVAKRPSTPNYSQQNSTNETNGSRRNSTSSQSANIPANPLVDQLKYENDRLKIALAQSSANAKKWEVELQTLKNNNARLTTALQESTSNVEEWKKQLSAYKEESARMKRKVLEMEKLGGSELLQVQLNEQRDRIQELESQTTRKDKEISDLTRKADAAKTLQSENQNLQKTIQELKKQNEVLRRDEGDLRVQLTNLKSEQVNNRQSVNSVQEQLKSKLEECLNLNSQLKKYAN